MSVLTAEEFKALEADVLEEDKTLSDEGEHGGIYDPGTVLAWLRSLNDDRRKLLAHIRTLQQMETDEYVRGVREAFNCSEQIVRSLAAPKPSDDVRKALIDMIEHYKGLLK